MPIWLRKYTFNLIKDYHEKPQKELEKQKIDKIKELPKLPTSLPINKKPSPKRS